MREENVIAFYYKNYFKKANRVSSFANFILVEKKTKRSFVLNF